MNQESDSTIHPTTTGVVDGDDVAPSSRSSSYRSRVFGDSSRSVTYLTDSERAIEGLGDQNQQLRSHLTRTIGSLVGGSRAMIVHQQMVEGRMTGGEFDSKPEVKSELEKRIQTIQQQVHEFKKVDEESVGVDEEVAQEVAMSEPLLVGALKVMGEAKEKEEMEMEIASA